VLVLALALCAASVNAGAGAKQESTKAEAPSIATETSQESQVTAEGVDALTKASEASETVADTAAKVGSHVASLKKGLIQNMRKEGQNDLVQLAGQVDKDARESNLINLEEAAKEAAENAVAANKGTAAEAASAAELKEQASAEKETTAAATAEVKAYKDFSQNMDKVQEITGTQEQAYTVKDMDAEGKADMRRMNEIVKDLKDVAQGEDRAASAGEEMLANLSPDN